MLRFNAKHYRRRYLQFNDLVFHNIDMVDEDDYSVSFKSWDEEYTFTHGSYYPLKADHAIAKMGRASFTIHLDMQEIPCEYRPYYVRFAINELMKPGRLWAVKDETIVWAWAVITNYREDTNDKKGYFSIDVSFDLPEGVWHKADKLKTFVKPFDPCDFMDCYDWQENNPCTEFDGNCCNCSTLTDPIICACCEDGDCDEVDKDEALCFFDDYQSFYGCEVSYRIVYNCIAGEKYFGDPLSNNNKGRKFCNTCAGHVIGRLYSDTDFPTDGVMIRLHSKEMHNPYIEINGNANIIMGDYEGYLDIYPNGEVYSYKDFDCPQCEPLPTSVWTIPKGMSYGWTVKQGYNHFEVDVGSCCQLCVYFVVDSKSV